MSDAADTAGRGNGVISPNEQNVDGKGAAGGRVSELRRREESAADSSGTDEKDGDDTERGSKLTVNVGPGTSTTATTLTATDREKASLNTQTPSTPHAREAETDTDPALDKREANEKSSKPASANTVASKSTEKQQQQKSQAQQKPSFWSNFFRSLFCLGSSDVHDLDVDAATGAKKATGKPARSATQPQKEKQDKPGAATKTTTQSSVEKKQASTTSSTVKHVPTPLDTTAQTVPLDLPLVIPPSTPSRDRNADPSVIVPPTPPSHILPPSETGGVTSGSVQPPGSTGEESLMIHRLDHSHHAHHSHLASEESRAGTDGEGDADLDGEGDDSYTDDEEAGGDTTQDTTGNIQSPSPHGQTHIYQGMTSEEEEEERLILQGGAGIPIGPDGEPRPLLPQLLPGHQGRKCLVLDLDETLVHSSFKLIPQADYVVPVEIEHQFHNVYVIKRPGVDAFLQKMGELYEIVVFTASLSKYADPVLDKLDISRVVTHRLFRESCYQHKGNYIKDLSQLGRPLSSTIILDNSPASYIFHPNNAVPVSSWFNDPHDTELVDLCPFLGDLKGVDDVRGVLDGAL